MNLVLETFERVLYPSGGAATRRASASGLAVQQQQQQRQPAADRQQMGGFGGRRQSGGGGGVNTSQCTRWGSPMLMSSANGVTVFDPPRGSASERAVLQQQQQSKDLAGFGEGGELGGSRTPSRSRSSARRKKSTGSHPRKQSMASLLYAVISASAPSTQQRRRSRLPPPRQWSVPERGSLDLNSEDEPFRLVQKAPSATLSPSPSYSTQQRTPPPRERLSIENMSGSKKPTETPLPDNVHYQSVLLGFATGASSLRSSRFGRLPSDRSPLESLFLAQHGRIRQWPTLSRALMLRCVDPEPLYPFLHYAVFEGCGTSAEVADEMNRTSVGHAEFGIFGRGRGVGGCLCSVSFEEVIALERQAACDAFCTSPTASASVHAANAHGGFIVLCFRLLDGQTGNSARLENTWLSWTGAHEIYKVIDRSIDRQRFPKPPREREKEGFKYSPRAWQLRRLSLHRRVPFPATAPPSAAAAPPDFGYVLFCEFGSILHPTNALAALDMCERLRTRNCGTVSLFQVRHCFDSPSTVSVATFPSNGHFAASPTVPNSLSPHWSPHQIRRSAAAYRLSRMGYSQDVPDSADGMAERRTMLLRMRERSLGWDGERSGTAL
ncbi:hypothetical protein GPALN_012646 [Globodera pallida]|nr:hypothetical protein GPALN_012646 [Globodera pallida]